MCSQGKTLEQRASLRAHLAGGVAGGAMHAAHAAFKTVDRALHVVLLLELFSIQFHFSFVSGCRGAHRRHCMHRTDMRIQQDVEVEVVGLCEKKVVE